MAGSIILFNLAISGELYHSLPAADQEFEGV